MDFETKARIVGEAWLYTRPTPIQEDDVWIVDNAEWLEFHRYADVGLPLAFAVTHGFATATDAGTSVINEAYSLLLSVLNVPDAEYNHFNDLLDANMAAQEG